ncbi:HPr family phosphocarrier protein [Desmospora profundinema]|uniref:Phosphocarrier protein HPr n=1 Tax=Desmospora profundinema TaxID=1571184 RepID=A0ABU1ILZ1_9BACL|nr:HPr family phosphocarrier protein [Desmospora profundinema]MDR6225758.1 phosphocarrier protein [Desmospora profundinema]
MVEQTLTIPNQTGLHARPAALLVKEAGRYASQVYIAKGDKQADAKSLLGVMSLSIRGGEEIAIRAEGDDEKEAVQALAQWIANELRD